MFTSSGDSSLIKGEQVEYTTFLEENERLAAEELIPAQGERESTVTISLVRRSRM